MTWDSDLTTDERQDLFYWLSNYDFNLPEVNNGSKNFIEIFSFERIANDDFIEISFNGEDLNLILSSDGLSLDHSFDPNGLQALYLKLRDLFYWLSKSNFAA
jgi:hypothetical protein